MEKLLRALFVRPPMTPKGSFQNLLHALASLAAITLWFTAVLGCAALLGGLLTLVATYCPWVPAWMIGVGKVVESVIFAADIACVGLAVVRTTVSHFLD